MRGITKAGLIITLLISSMIGVVSGQYLYLIQNEVDSESWIITNQDVIFNASLGAWLLNSTNGASPTYEDFTTYSEIVGGAFSQTTLESIWTNYDRTDEGRVYLYNHPSATGETFSAYFELDITSIENNAGGTIMIYPFIVSGPSVAPDMRDLQNNYEESYGIQLSADLSQSTTFRMRIIETENGNKYSGTETVLLNVGSTYYLNFTKSGADLTLEIYSDADYSSLVDTVAHTMQTSNNSLDMLSIPIGHDASSGPRDSSGSVSMLTFDEPGGGYELEGYLYSDDLLVNTTMGPGYVFCTGQTVPDGASLKVAFSNDNSSWVRETTLSTTTGSLKESIFLNDLNYTTIYVRYQFEGDGSVSPQLTSMAIAYEIDEPEGNANGWIYLGGVVSFIIGLALKRPM